MKIALIGCGAMGNLVRKLAEEKGHEIAAVVNRPHAGLSPKELSERLSAAEAAIDFSAADAVLRNVEACLSAGVPIIEGTTGWNDQLAQIASLVNDRGGAMVFGANFSIGVNLFYKIAEHAAELLAKFPEYEAFIEEQHHSRKKDAPSGTALKLKELVSSRVNIGDVAATRAGGIPGTHRLGFDAANDQILLEHTARSRDGFAFGAVKAAEWIVGKTGFYEFYDIIHEVGG